MAKKPKPKSYDIDNYDSLDLYDREWFGKRVVLEDHEFKND